MPSLYTLSAEYAAIRARLMETQEDEQTIADTLEGEGWELEKKIIGTAYVIREMEAHIAARKAAVEEMRESIKRAENRLDRLKNYLMTAMQTAGMKKVAGEHFDVRVKQKAQAVIVEDEAKIPERFYRLPEGKPPSPVLDKMALRAAMMMGETVPGAHLDDGVRLDIR